LTQPGPEAYEIKFVGIPQGQSTLIPNLPPLKHQKGVRVH